MPVAEQHALHLTPALGTLTKATNIWAKVDQQS